MNIPKQLVIGVIIGLLIGASILYAFTQYSLPAKDDQISALQNEVASLENFILLDSQKSAGLPLVGASAEPTKNAVIQNVSLIEGGLLVWARATSGQDVTITTAWIKHTNGTIITMGRLNSNILLPMDGTSKSITVLVPYDRLTSGSNYTVTLVSTYGEPLVSPTFTFTGT